MHDDIILLHGIQLPEAWRLTMKHIKSVSLYAQFAGGMREAQVVFDTFSTIVYYDEYVLTSTFYTIVIRSHIVPKPHVDQIDRIVLCLLCGFEIFWHIIFTIETSKQHNHTIIYIHYIQEGYDYINALFKSVIYIRFHDHSHLFVIQWWANRAVNHRKRMILFWYILLGDKALGCGIKWVGSWRWYGVFVKGSGLGLPFNDGIQFVRTFDVGRISWKSIIRVVYWIKCFTI